MNPNETSSEYRDELLTSETRLKILRKKALRWQIFQIVMTLLLGISLGISIQFTVISLSVVNIVLILAIMMASYCRLNTIVYCNQAKMKIFRYLNAALELLLVTGIVLDVLMEQGNSFTPKISIICRDLNLSLLVAIIVIEIYLTIIMKGMCGAFSRQMRSLSLRTAVYDKSSYEGVMKSLIVVQKKNSIHEIYN